ncbi:MAG: hypothetical protein QXS91_00035 [Candidatus Anstonellales archaeon]
MVDKSIYWKGAAVALILFIISIGIGYYIEVDRTNKIRDTINELNIAIDSSSTTILFIQSTKNKANCVALKSAVYELWQETNKIRNTLEDQNINILISPNELRNLYYLTNFKLYLLTREYKEVCQQNLSNILFFYVAFKDCPECKVQGNVLDVIREKCDNAAVFAFPIDVKGLSPLNVIVSYYNITSAPTLIIDDKKFDTLLNEASIKEKINCK